MIPWLPLDTIHHVSDVMDLESSTFAARDEVEVRGAQRRCQPVVVAGREGGADAANLETCVTPPRSALSLVTAAVCGLLEERQSYDLRRDLLGL